MNSNDFQPKITMLYFKVENTLNFLNEIGSLAPSLPRYRLKGRFLKNKKKMGPKWPPYNEANSKALNEPAN